MLMTAAFLTALISLSLMALAMKKHHRQVFGKRPTKGLKTALRICALPPLVISLVLSAELYGWSVGTVLWLGLLNLAAILIAMYFTYAPLHSSAGKQN